MWGVLFVYDDQTDAAKCSSAVIGPLCCREARKRAGSMRMLVSPYSDASGSPSLWWLHA